MSQIVVFSDFVMRNYGVDLDDLNRGDFDLLYADWTTRLSAMTTIGESIHDATIREMYGDEQVKIDWKVEGF